MKTIADFKKKMIIGAKVHSVFHQGFGGRSESGDYLFADEDKGIREVSIIQSNSFAFKTQKKDGTYHDSWCNWPKKDEIKFLSENSVQLLMPDFRVPGNNQPLIPFITYTFV